MVQLKFQAGWGWDDLAPLVLEAVEMAQSRDETVSILFDYRETDGKIPSNFLMNMAGIGKQTPDNVDVVYVLSRRGVLARTMANLIGRLANMNFELRVISSIREI